MDYSVTAIAKKLGIGKHKVFRWLERGEIAGYDVSEPGTSRRQWRVTQAALNAFIAKRSNLSTDKENPDV